MKKLLRTLIKILIFIIVFNFASENFSYAFGTGVFEDDDTSFGEMLNVYDEDDFDAYANEGKATIDNDSAEIVEISGNNSQQSYVVTFIMSIINVIPITVHMLISVVCFDVRNMKFFTIEDLVLNKIQLFDINIFNRSTNSEINNLFKEQITKWFVTMRNFGIIFSLLVLVYIAMRMIISTIAEEKAKYKRMLFDWFVGFLIIFVILYGLAAVFQVYDMVLSRTTIISYYRSCSITKL